SEIAEDAELQGSILVRQGYGRSGRSLHGLDNGAARAAAIAATGPGPSQEKDKCGRRPMPHAHSVLHSRYLGSTSSMQSAMMSPGLAPARACRIRFSRTRWFWSICSGVASFGSLGSVFSTLVWRSTYSLRRSFIVASALASASLSGPTTRWVGGADAGD